MFYKKQESIKELEQMMERHKERYDSDMKKSKEKIEELEKQLRGERVIGIYCNNCEHVIKNNYGVCACILECNCKDFNQRK